jgi:micrococcal nuclease
MRIVVAVTILLAATIAGWRIAPHAGRPPLTGAPGEVVHVPDGDTIDVIVDGSARPVRVIGIDTPEIAHDGRAAACFGDRAGEFTRSMLLHRRVALVAGVERVDRYGRLLAAVRPLSGPLRGADLAEVLATGGLARPLAIAPNDGNAARIAALVAGARAAHRGLWAACTFHDAYPRAR